MTLDTETTIVGAGPYGLSIAAHLEAARMPYLLFGSPLESWRRHMPSGMVLKSERFASNLWDPERRYTLRRYCELKNLPYRSVGDPLSLALFLEYADWFRENAVGKIHETKVARIARTSRRDYRLELVGGAVVSSRRVILATGHMDFRNVPPELQGLPEPLVSHSSCISDVHEYRGREVLIIGAGQSALETAALLHEAGARVRVLARRSRVEWNTPSKLRPLAQRILVPDAGIASGWQSVAVSELPRLFRRLFAPPRRHRFVAGSYGPSGAWWLKDRVAGRIEIETASQIERARIENGRPVLRARRAGEIREIAADHVIAATGFKVDIDRVEILDPAIRRDVVREAGGIPALDGRFETSIPGLFVVGVASSPVFGPIMRFMYGAKHPARVLAGHLKRA